jgi:hypothetical protein
VGSFTGSAHTTPGEGRIVKPQGNGVYDRDGKFFMEPSLVKMSAFGIETHMPKGEVGPFDSLDEADAAASYVFAQWIMTGQIPPLIDIKLAIVRAES